jgi:hypothetical protein
LPPLEPVLTVFFFFVFTRTLYVEWTEKKTRHLKRQRTWVHLVYRIHRYWFNSRDIYRQKMLLM